MNILAKIYSRLKIEYLRNFNLVGYNCYIYQLNTGRVVNLKEPQTMDEKIIYMSFWGNHERWSELADKVKVRDYVEQCGFSTILPKRYGVYTTVNEIDFDKLPNNGFVIKTNNASGTNIIVHDKATLDIQSVKKQLDKWLKRDYSKISGDPHYAKIEPMILVEELLHDDSIYNTPSLADYKFFCANGVPICVEMMTDRTRMSHKRRFYDIQWQVHDEWMLKGFPIAEIAEKPQCFKQMVDIAKTLSTPFPFVRVDFYVIDNKPIFGEMTFTPGATECSDEMEMMMGELIDINYSYKANCK